MCDNRVAEQNHSSVVIIAQILQFSRKNTKNIKNLSKFMEVLYLLSLHCFPTFSTIFIIFPGFSKIMQKSNMRLIMLYAPSVL